MKKTSVEKARLKEEEKMYKGGVYFIFEIS